MVNEKFFNFTVHPKSFKLEVVESKALKSELSQTIVLLTKNKSVRKCEHVQVLRMIGMRSGLHIAY
jgi:hypothetical protein